MKRILSLLSVIILATMNVDLGAQKKTENDYNLRKAYEVLKEEEDEAKALDLVNKQLRETPDNVDALMLRLRLYRNKKEYGLALQDANHVQRVNKPKKTDLPTSSIHWWKAYIYDDMGDKDSALASLKTAYELARKDNKDNLQSIAFDYAQALYYKDDLDGADVIYRQMLKENEADGGAMVGLSRNMIDRGQCKEALELLDRCQRMDSGYAEVYRFRMQAYDKLGETTSAIDAALDWYDKNDDASTAAICKVLSKRPSYAEASLKSRAKKSESPFGWKALLCQFYETAHKYAEAVKAYDELEAEFGHYDQINYYRSDNYARLGLYEKAIEDISRIMEKEPSLTLLATRGEYLCDAGRYAEAVADFSAAIEEEPTSTYAYYGRGWNYEILGEDAKALEDYNTALDIDQDDSYYHLMRGRLLERTGRHDEAVRDYEAILQLDTAVVDGSRRHYALHFFGRDDEALEWADKILDLDQEDRGNHYDKGCLLSLMGRPDEAVACLRKALEMGYRNFVHFAVDKDLDPIRELPEYKAMIEEYKAKHAEYLKEFELEMPASEETVTEIAVKRNPGGTFEIPCDINGLALQMIFDTGASDVTISSVEANFMFKNGYLSEKDIKGKRYYQVASGQLNEGTVITLREVRIGDAVLKNVDASVVKSQKAPLLLGQSAMERFGTITIDNQNNRLIIKH